MHWIATGTKSPKANSQKPLEKVQETRNSGHGYRATAGSPASHTELALSEILKTRHWFCFNNYIMSVLYLPSTIQASPQSAARSVPLFRAEPFCVFIPTTTPKHIAQIETVTRACCTSQSFCIYSGFQTAYFELFVLLHFKPICGCTISLYVQKMSRTSWLFLI